MPQKQAKTGGKVIGEARIAAFAGVDDDGLAVVEGPIVTVNEDMTAPNLKHQSRIAGRKFTLIETEDKDAKVQGKRMVSYRKEIQGVQSPMDGETSKFPGRRDVTGPSGYDEGEPSASPGELTGLQAVKNFADKLSDRIDRMDLKYGLLTGIALVLGALAVGGLIFHG